MTEIIGSSGYPLKLKEFIDGIYKFMEREDESNYKDTPIRINGGKNGQPTYRIQIEYSAQSHDCYLDINDVEARESNGDLKNGNVTLKKEIERLKTKCNELIDKEIDIEEDLNLTRENSHKLFYGFKELVEHIHKIEKSHKEFIKKNGQDNQKSWGAFYKLLTQLYEMTKETEFQE